MAREISVLGAPTSGKTFFINALALYLESRKMGYLERIHPQYSKIMDYALAGEIPAITPEEKYEGLLIIGKRKVPIIEHNYSWSLFSSDPGHVRDGFSSSRCVVAMLDSSRISKTDENAMPVSYDLDMGKLKNSIRMVTHPLMKEFKPWYRIFRKVKRVFFVTTRANHTNINDAQLGQAVEDISPELTKYITKRKAEYSFHALELLKEGGINLSDMEYIASEILDEVR